MTMLTDEEILSMAKSKLSLRSDVHPSDTHFFVKGFVSGGQYARDRCEAREKLWLELLNNSCLFAVCSAAGVLTHETTVGRIAELRAALGIDKEGA